MTNADLNSLAEFWYIQIYVSEIHTKQCYISDKVNLVYDLV